MQTIPFQRSHTTSSIYPNSLSVYLLFLQGKKIYVGKKRNISFAKCMFCNIIKQFTIHCQVAISSCQQDQNYLQIHTGLRFVLLVTNYCISASSRFFAIFKTSKSRLGFGRNVDWVIRIWHRVIRRPIRIL